MGALSHLVQAAGTMTSHKHASFVAIPSRTQMDTNSDRARTSAMASVYADEYRDRLHEVAFHC